jgi:L-threonylcarbamoyladenylate synthase
MAEREQSDVGAAVAILRKGGIVAFPTETVYGLGADARNSTAVRKIFAAKGRPSTNPLIVHVADESVAKRFASHWPKQAEKLAAAFWPGPLTIVVPKSESIVSEVSAGLGTVGLRVPNHPVALQLLQEFDGPVAAPSANPSGRVSPTTAEHVRKELGDKVDLILDGGPCQVGIESTVLALVEDTAVILRPGGISRRQIEELIGTVEVATAASPDGPAMSPGMQAVHYSPAARMIRFEADQIGVAEDWCRRNSMQNLLILIIAEHDDSPSLHNASNIAGSLLYMPFEPTEYAQKLYAVLHNSDERGIDVVLVQMPPDVPSWTAVRDRLSRASKSI